MKKMVVFTLIIVFGLLSGCSLNENTIESTESLTESSKYVGQSFAYPSKHFKTLDEIEESSELIVEVMVKDNPTWINYQGVQFITYELVIKDVIKDDELLDKSEITLIAIGDYYEVNEKYLIFLEKYVGPVVDDAYITLGVYQGQFKIDKSDNLKYVGEFSNGVKYFQDELNGLSVDKAKEKIKNNK